MTTTKERHLRQIDLQAAGHPGTIFKSDDVDTALVLKPVDVDEQRFYEQASQMNHWLPFLPSYHGVVEEDELHLIKLQDLTAGCARPCVVDIKMGVCTAAPSANAAKRADMRGKDLKTTTHSLGLRICGMQVGFWFLFLFSCTSF